MILIEDVYLFILILTILVTAATIVIHILKREELTSEASLKKLKAHATMFRTVFILGISALCVFITYEMLEILKMIYYPPPSNELFLIIKTLMFFLVLCSFTLNIKIVTMILGDDE